MRNNLLSILSISLMLSCNGKDKGYDATGIFEATEVTVSAEQNGRILSFSINEGDRIVQGVEVALIDTIPLHLKAMQMGASKMVYASQRPDQDKQVAATRQQLAKARAEYDRFSKLVEEGAADSKSVDDAANQVRVLERQLEAQRSSLHHSTASLNAQMGSADIQRLQILDQLEKCHVTSPVFGTILEKYMEQGEFAVVGRPLFKVADISHLFLRCYLTSAQLKDVKIGQKATVFADYGDGERRTYPGKVTWISAKSEFTPKTILTDDERADLVYAVKVAIKNDGYAKIGMYGEVKL